MSDLAIKIENTTTPVHDIYDLQNYLAIHKREELQELETKHYQCKHLYVRQVIFNKDDLAVGRVHKQEHMALITGGPMVISTYICDEKDNVIEDLGTKEYYSGDVIISKPGTKRAVVAKGPGTFLCLHYAEKTTLDDLEQELMQKDYLALYDSNNKLIDKLISADAILERIKQRDLHLIGVN
jgi:quercetin dioxygenase-like cupin family protein